MMFKPYSINPINQEGNFYSLRLIISQLGYKISTINGLNFILIFQNNGLNKSSGAEYLLINKI